MDSDSDTETRLLFLLDDLGNEDERFETKLENVVSFVRSLDLESQPKPETEFMSHIIRIITLYRSMDLDSQPEPLSKGISLFNKVLDPTDFSCGPDADEMTSLFSEIIALEPEPELISLAYKILSFFLYFILEGNSVIMVCPQAQVRLGEDNILCIDEEVQFGSKCNKWECIGVQGKKDYFVGASRYLACESCNGENHERFKKAPVEIKHPLHPQHSLQLVLLEVNGRERKCHCCDENLRKIIYCCLACDYAMSIVCVEKPTSLIYTASQEV